MTKNIPSPVDTDPDKYKIIFENKWIKVYDYQDKPTEKTKLHRHNAFLLYALIPFKRKLTLENNKSVVREFEKGEILWSDGEIHIGENIGTTNTHVLIVELKKTE